MPIVVGTLQNITFQVFEPGDLQLGQQVRLQLARYAQECREVKAFIQRQPAVMVNIKKYAGTGAVTIYRTKSITVSRSLAGGVAETAESVLFELCNWDQGDFSTREHNRCKAGEITPQQAGEAIARCESKSVYTHGVFLQQIKAAGISLSNYGETNRKAITGMSLAQVEQQTMITAHSGSKDVTDIASLPTPEMYWLQMIDGTYDPKEFHVPIQKRGIVGQLPAWLDQCIDKVWSHLLYSNKSVFMTKLFELAKACGHSIKGGYELTPAMRQVAGTVGPVHVVERGQIRGSVVGKLNGAPGDLETKMQGVGLL